MTTQTADIQQVSHFWSKLNLIADIARVLREKPVGREAVLEVFDLIVRLIPYDAATLFLYNKRRDCLDEVVARGESIHVLDFLHFGAGTGLAGWAAEQKRAIVLPGRDPEGDRVQRHHDSVIILPLVVAQQLVGVLCFSHRDREAFDENRQKMLEIVADQVAISIERILHQRQLERSNRQLLKAQQDVKEAQVQTVNAERLKAVLEVAASVNHEVNNPLSIIVGNAQMIEMDTAGMPPSIAGRVKAIVDAARRISLITHKLLKVDRVVTQEPLGKLGDSMLDLDKSSGDCQC